MFSDLFRNQKKIPFSSFVNYALYSPNGYYNKESRISKEGDFLTSPTTSKIYGQVIASSLINKAFLDFGLDCKDKNYPSEAMINLVELGSNDGTLMRHVVDYLYKFPAVYERLNIVTIEKNLKLHKKIYQNLFNHSDKLLVSTSLDNLSFSSDKAAIFCNEFFDALLFERCIKKNEKLYQVNIQIENNNVVESLELLDSKLLEKFNEYKLKCKEDAFFEFPLFEYEEYFRLITKNFKKIFFLINDYGDKSDFFQTSSDPFGTSRCFYNHIASRSFYDNIFYQDITHDVNFSLLSLVAQRFGLKEVSFSSQTKWILNSDLIQTPVFSELLSDPVVREGFSRLVHPNSMGERFKFISFQT